RLEHESGSEPSSELPRLNENIGIGRLQEVVFSGRIQGFECVGGSQLRVLWGVLELRCLGQPFNVGQATATKFQMARWISSARQPFRFNTSFHPPNRLQLLCTEAMLIAYGICPS